MAGSAIPKEQPARMCSWPGSAAAPSPAGSFSGWAGRVYTLFQNENLLGAWPGTPNYEPQWLKGAAIRADATPEYLGVGYIIGPRVAGVIFAGGVFSWLVIMPAIYFFGSHFPQAIYPGTKPIAQMSPSELWSSYIRPMGRAPWRRRG